MGRREVRGGGGGCERARERESAVKDVSAVAVMSLVGVRGGGGGGGGLVGCHDGGL